MTTPKTAPTMTPAAPVWWLIACFAAAKVAIHVVALEGYGFFRDELYYFACAERLAWGYVDHPPLSIAALSALVSIFGENLWTLRLPAALLGAALVATVGWLAARLGGRLGAQALAMTAALVVPSYLALHHFYSMNAWSLLFWTLASAALVSALDGGGRRHWGGLGVVLGLGLLNKIDVLWLGAGLGAGLLVADRRRLLTPEPWIAGEVSFAIFTPHLIWQAVNGWPTVEFVRNAGSNKMKTTAPVDYVVDQIMATHPLSLPIWLGGLAFLLFSSRGRAFRVAGWIYPSVLLILLINGTSRSGYLAGAYPLLFAAGGVLWEGVVQRWRRAGTAVLAGYALVLAATGAFLAPLALPILSVEDYLDRAQTLGVAPSTSERKEIGELPQFYADMFGWPEMAEEVARVWESLDAGEREGAAIFVGNYGEAGALRYFGRRHGLPPVLSGHNNHWLWGLEVIEEHGLTGDVVLILGGREESHLQRFHRVERAGETRCTYCMPYENGVPIFIAREPRGDLREFWPAIKHFE
ncbi:MAG: glycosyltransferase family 39 protein [Acidobacteriota bacterium]